MPMSKILGSVFLPAVVTAVIGWNMSAFIGHSVFGTKSNDAFMFACVPIIVFYVGLFLRSTKEDRRGLGALLAFFAVSIVFWVIYNQNSTGLTIWAQTYTDRSMPAPMEKVLAPFQMFETVTTDSLTVTKIDSHFVAALDADGNTIEARGLNPYLQNLPQTQWPAPHQPLKLISTEIYQSVNPFFIVIFTPLIAVWFFGWLRKRKREPSTPAKVGWGMIIAGLSSLLMVFAVMSTNVYTDKTSMWWLISTYAIFTIGELLISPIGLSLVSKLSPVRTTALMMGGWFLVNAIAGKISGLMATFWDSFPDKKNYFLILFVAAMISGVIMFTLVKWIREVVHEKTGSV
jgi:POT family proton-dependent oligopeptide transporter